MSFRVLMVTGPRRSGKSTLISLLVDEVCPHPPHFVRLTPADGGKRAPRVAARPDRDCGVASARWVLYNPRTAFDAVSSVLSEIHRAEQAACVIIEADTDSNLRHAYPYDLQIFTMAAPDQAESVFRTPAQTRAALRSAMHDTTAFAQEFYGLPEEDDSTCHAPTKSRPEMSDAQMLEMLGTPLGRELATRVQCQPAYHGLVESDLVLVNTGIGGTSQIVDEVVTRLEVLVAQACPAEQRPEIFCCDACDRDDPRRVQLLERIKQRQQ